MTQPADWTAPPHSSQEKLAKVFGGILVLEAVLHVLLRVVHGTVGQQILPTVSMLCLVIGASLTLFRPSKTREAAQLKMTLGIYTMIAFSLMIH